MTFHQIPVLSLDDWSGPGADRDAFAQRLRDACHHVGFFRLVDHGVDRAFLDDYFATLRLWSTWVRCSRR